jgi:hypothetical protein
LLVHCFRELLLEKHDDVLDVLARHHFQSQLQRLSPHIQIRTRQYAQDLHGQVVQNALVVFSQLVDLVEDNELNIVVRFLDGQLDEFAGGSLYGNWVACQSREGRSSFIDNCGSVGLKELKD